MHSLLCLLALTAAAGEQRVLVLDLEAVGVPATEAAAATRIITGAASEAPGRVIMSTADLRRLAALEADKYSAGCMDDASCVADLAGALGAEQVLYGALSRLGSTTTVSLSLYTASSGDVQRRSVDVKDIDDLAPILRAKTAELLAGAGATSTKGQAADGRADGGDGREAGGDEGPTVANGEGGSTAGLIVGIVGGVVAAAGAGAAIYSEVKIQDPKGAGSEKETWQLVGLGGIAAVAVGVVVAVVGGVMIGGAE